MKRAQRETSLINTNSLLIVHLFMYLTLTWIELLPGRDCYFHILVCMGHIDCFHTTAKCVFWILIQNAHFELRSVHMIEVLAYFELRIIHTSDWKCDSPFESVEKRHGCVWVACQSNMHMCCLRFLCMCSARYYRWKWLEGHTSSAPQNTILRSSHSYTDFVAWFARIVTGKHLCTVIWDAHFKLRFATWFGIHTVFFAYFEF